MKALLSKPSKNNEPIKDNEAKKSVAGISLPSLVPLMKKEKTAEEELQLELANVISEIEAQAKNRPIPPKPERSEQVHMKRLEE